ncbi:MAG: flagellar hook-basal body complex protein FliE [Desulfobacteraceae bacterium 4572_187]|nr:MAG: flagellar hook-basal body complex protein FliE [Desulfobacteraceae bacterium 4572_187]
MDKISNQNISKAYPDLLTGNKQAQKVDGKSFGEIIKSSIANVDKIQKDSDKAVRNLATGKENDIHKTMIIMEKAEISFQLMMAVRNKIITAYQTIMRMQI